MHREPELPSEAITCTYEVDDNYSRPPASKKAGKCSISPNATDHSPNALHVFRSLVGACHDHADVLASNASHVPTSLSIFAKTSPACIDGRLLPPPILHWLRCRLATGERTGSTHLTVAWWQPILMQILPLHSWSNTVNYRLHHPKPSTCCSRSAFWWREKSIKNPSVDEINRVCGDYRLIYLRTIDVLNVGELKLRLHFLFRRYCIPTMFPFATNLWEILVTRKDVDRFIQCAEACGYVVDELVRPGEPVGRPSDFRCPFDSRMVARERLIGRASIARLVSGDSEFASCTATIYRDLVKLYRCYDAYNTVVLALRATDHPPYSPGWSCIIGFSQYPTNDAGTKEHCE